MTRLLFIVLPDYQLEPASSASDWRPPFLCLPMGVLSISAYIRNYCTTPLDIQLLNLNECLYECAISGTADREALYQRIEQEIQDRIQDGQPDIIACSTLFNACFAYVDTVVKSIEKTGTQALLVFGGKVATNHYDQFLDSFQRIDAVSYAEGEIPFFQLLQAMDHRQELESNPSFATREKLRKQIKPTPQYVEHLDDIPVFAFDLLDIEKYIGKYYESIRFSAVKYLDQIAKQDRGLYVISSRGCPYQCVFCCSGSVHGRKVRYRTPESIVNEVIYLKNTYHLTLINFQDDNFFQDKQRALEILDRLIALNLDLKYEFANGIITYRVDDDIVSRLKQLGVPGMTLAIESGSERVLRDIVRKPLQLPQVYRAVASLRKYGLRVYASFVFGFPGETEEDRQMSIQLIQQVGFDWVHLFAAIPFSGSRLYDICIENHYIEGQEQELLNAKKYSAGIINTPDFSSDYINDFIYRYNLQCNFLENYNYRSGNYALAASFFEDILSSYSSHAFAHYMLWRCYEKTGDEDGAMKHKRAFQDIMQKDSFWQNCAVQCGLEWGNEH